MAENKGLIDKLSTMPKWQVILITVVVLALVGFPVYYLGFGMNSKPVETEIPKVEIDIPDASTGDYERSRVQAYIDADLNKSVNNNAQQYWDDLGQALVSGSTGGSSRSDRFKDVNSPDYLDPSVYTQYEIRLIETGQSTKEKIDAKHAKDAEENAAREKQIQALKRGPMSQQEKDSIYFARLERTLQMTSKVAATMAPDPTGAAGEEDFSDEPAEPERTIDLGASTSALPAKAMGDNDIITSLVGDEDDDIVHSAGMVHSKPVKATFLKNETVNSGQRIIIRLMQDLTLSDGTLIPANTHITGTCSISNRLKIDVKMLHYNGRMFPTDISVYDNDGTEGIYCPSAEEAKRRSKKVKQVISDASSALTSTVGTLVSGNPLYGRMMSSSMNGISSTIQEDGSVSINVAAGYEFYVFENVKN